MKLRRSSKLVVPVGVLLGSLALVAGVLAYSATSWINLTVAGASGSSGGGVFIQGGIGAGTGTFDPFLTLSSNDPTEKGYNTTAASGEFDTFFGGGRTHPIQAAAIPPVNYLGTLYREFSLDANDQGNNDYMSIDKFKVLLDDQNNLTGFVDGATPTFSNDNATTAVLKYALADGTVVLMRSQGLTPGSGVSDITALVPDSLFPANCYYGSTTCGQWVYLYTEMGGFDGLSGPVSGKNWDVTAGFEEWRTRLLPVVNVTKTANTSYTQPYTWTVDKKVKVDGTCEDSNTVNLFKGDSQAADWCITPTRTAGTPTNPTVSGSITITNPTHGTVISEPINAVISAKPTDVITQGGTTTNATVTCPVSFPYTLQEQQTLTCTYTASVPSTASGTNTATATLSGPVQSYSGSAVVNFSSATVNETNENATLTDLAGPLNQAAVSGQTVYVSKTYTCNADQGTKNNTATVTPTEGGTPASDSASLTINCASLTVIKDAATTYTRTFPWTIQKSVTPATWDLFAGDSGTSRYTVAVTKGTGTDDTFAVSGNIHVNNPASMAATLTGVSDVLTGALSATVACGVTFPYPLAAGATLDCTYSRSLPTNDSRTNTATATLQNHSYTSAGVGSNSGTTDFSGQATVTFGAPSALVNDSINVDDTNGGTWLFSASGSVNYDKTFTCDTDKGKHDNTATIRETGLTSSASVTVSCYEITVSKTATTSFTRTFHWTIDKYSTDPNGAALTLNPGESYIGYPYTIKVDLAPTPYTDSDWAVAGQITVHNSAPVEAKINGVSDELTGPIAASVTCPVTFPYMLAAGGDLVCSYSTSLPDATSRTNTATAVRQNRSFDYLLVASDKATTTSTSGTAAVTFGAPTTLVDETVTIVDDFGTPADPTDDKSFGPLSYTDTLPAYFTYNRDFGPYTSAECGDIHVDNTATLTTNNTATKVSDTWNLTITIPCPTGCTLTQGYWKTHSILGPVPLSKADPTWYVLDSRGPNTPFFLSGQTWFQVFWTSPKGGNPYYILAHQYEGAKLNILSGAASTPAVDAAIAWAETFFNTYTPTSNFSKALKNQATQYAGTLGSYNEGLIGPGHCSVDNLGRSAQQ